jgi:hypothetical protein
MDEPVYRNYNIGRDIDEKTEEFEEKLKALVIEYGAYNETESFYKKD